jgi:sulfate transport system substrate-binding protein
MRFATPLLLGALLGACADAAPAGGAPVELLNVSYDPTSALYRDLGDAFARGRAEPVVFHRSHGGSGKQARAVIDGLPADIVTLGLAGDVDAIANAGLLDRGWQKRLPDASSPFTSTIVILVRAGNPKRIRDFDDLARPGVAVITPNPKVSGGARWGYLALWDFAMRRASGDEHAALGFLRAVFANVPVLDSGARGAMTTFAQRGIGDALIAWENEALLAARELWPGEVEVVTPSRSILAEPPVAVVDGVVDRRGTRAVAEGFLRFLYTEEAQRIAARRFYRPRSASALHEAGFAAIPLVTIAELGGWPAAQKKHFADGGTFDRLYEGQR